MEKQEKLSVRQAFVQELENKILSGELRVGEKLPPARELCHIMGVSELVSKGFLEVKQQKARRKTVTACWSSSA